MKVGKYNKVEEILDDEVVENDKVETLSEDSLETKIDSKETPSNSQLLGKKTEKLEDSKKTVKAKKTVKSKKTGEVIPKKKGKPRGGNSPVIGNNGYNVVEGDNAKFTRINQEIFNLPDIDLKNANAVANRLSEFFGIYAKYDVKPTVAGMALSLNCMSRSTLRNIAHGTPTGGSGYTTALPSEVASVIKKAYFSMENLWEAYMNSGKINPVSGIFLAKNNFGYVDKTETVLTPNTRPEEDYSIEDIKKRYDSSDFPKRLSSDSQNDSDDFE